MRHLRSFNESMDMAKSIISKKMNGFERLKELLKNNLGYIGKFTEYLINENIPYEELENLYKKLLDLKSKSKNIDINSLKYEKALDKIVETENDLLITRLTNMFPKEQKDIAKEIAKNNLNLLLNVSKSDKKEQLISKISRYKDKHALENAMKLILKDSFYTKDKIKEYISNSENSKIVFENEDILVVLVSSIDDIKALGSDTSWCILTSSQWKSYTTGRFQFILYDFTKDEYNKEFKIGFTLEPSGEIYAAHDILDISCKNTLKDTLSKYDISNIQLITNGGITDSDIRSINSRVTLKSLSVILNGCKDSQLKSVLDRLLSIGQIVSGATISYQKRLIIKGFLKRYLNFTKTYTKKGIANINRDLLKMVQSYELNEIVINKDRFYIKPSILKTEENINVYITSGLSEWTDEAFMPKPGYSIEIDNIYRNGALIIPLESAKKILDRLNKIKNIKESRQAMALSIILNTILGNKVEQSVIDDYGVDLIKYNKYLNFDIKIDLDKIGYLDLSRLDVDNIIKKDYEKELFIAPHNIHYIDNITNYLKDFKLNLKIHKDSLKSANIRNGKSLRYLLDKISVIKSGTLVVSDNGKHTLTII